MCMDGRADPLAVLDEAVGQVGPPDVGAADAKALFAKLDDDDRVRRSVLDEPGVPHEVLELLATDHSSPIASAAAARLADPSDVVADGAASGPGGERRARHPQVPASDAGWLDDVLSTGDSVDNAPRDRGPQ